MLQWLWRLLFESTPAEFRSAFGLAESMERLRAATKRSVFSSVQVGFIVVFAAPVWLAAKIVGTEHPALIWAALSLILGAIGSAASSLLVISGGKPTVKRFTPQCPKPTTFRHPICLSN